MRQYVARDYLPIHTPSINKLQRSVSAEPMPLSESLLGTFLALSQDKGAVLTPLAVPRRRLRYLAIGAEPANPTSVPLTDREEGVAPSVQAKVHIRL
jgi:hypothetical protein